MKPEIQNYLERREFNELEAKRGEEQHINNLMRLNSWQNKKVAMAFSSPYAVPRLFTDKNSTVMEMMS